MLNMPQIFVFTSVQKCDRVLEAKKKKKKKKIMITTCRKKKPKKNHLTVNFYNHDISPKRYKDVQNNTTPVSLSGQIRAKKGTC